MLSPTHRKLLDFIRDEIAKSGTPPRLADMAAAMGYSATAARRGLLKLEKRGYITRQPRVPRSVRIKQPD